MLEQNLATYRAQMAAMTSSTEYQTFLSAASHTGAARPLGQVLN
jgi:hypothetical protein